MIEPEKLESVRVVYCHRNLEIPCPDGVASALLLRDALPSAEVRFVAYGADLARLKPHAGALFCDISPAPDSAGAWLTEGAIVLDHHVTAAPVTKLFAEAGQGAYASEPGVSGAVLAYREVWFPTRYPDGDAPGRRHAVVERFARLAGVRDTWQRESPEWREACAQAEALVFWPWDTWPAGIDLGLGRTMGNMLNLGYILLQKREARTKQIVADGYRVMTSKGTRLLILATKETSDAAEAAEDVDLVVGFGFSAPDCPEMSFSTRSRGAFDCAAFCKSHGGGGHARAAGFSRDLASDDEHPYELVVRLVEAWERSL